MQQEEKVLHIDIDLLVPNRYQPRKVFDEESLNELAKSISIYGIINPILVRKIEDKYEIIAGERRFRAAKKIGLKEVPIIVKNVDEQKLAEIALIENLQRQGLNPIEEAKSYQEIMRLGNETQKSLGEKLGKSQSAIANKIRLLSLPPKIQEALSQKKISERHARSLMTVEDEERKIELLNKVINEKLTVKDLDNIINVKKITEEEIQEAINDIMKSLNFDEEPKEKEEKESENMNNENFFPNFNNTMGANNNVSLNSMNMQSMNQSPMAPVTETVMPTPQPEMNQPQNIGISMPEQPIQMEQMAPMDQPLFGGNMDMSTTGPELVTSPQSPVNLQSMDAPQPMLDQPLFGGPTTMPIGPELNTPIDPLASPVIEPSIMPESVITAPQSDMMTPPPVTAPAFDIPVMAPTSMEQMAPMQQPEVDQYSKTIELLNQNGIPFKTYSNESGHCIIIEI